MTDPQPPVPIMLMVRTLGPGGTERQVTEIAKGLNRDFFLPHVGCFENSGFRNDELRASGVPVLTMRMRSFLSADSFAVYRAMRKYVREHRISLVHTFDFPMNIFCVPAARLMKVPVVLSSQRSYRELVPPRYLPALRISDRLSDGIVVNCEAIRKHLRESYSIPDSRIDTCYNAIDTSHFHSGARERPAPLQGASLVIGIVCVLRAIKSVETLISAFAAATDKMPSARLLIVGDGPEKEKLRRLASELNIAGKVIFAPSTNDVAPWLRAIDIFVLPSTSEALSNSLMEAMASGCCAIASRVGGNPELIDHGESGLLFEHGDPAGLADKLRLVIDDEGLRLRLADAGARRIATQFSKERSLAGISQVYRRYLDRK